MSKENKLVLVLGGARSGKSEFAEKFVLHAGNCAAILLRPKFWTRKWRNV